MSTPAKHSGKRILELDALRGLAALAVVLYHYTTRYEAKVGHRTQPAFELAFGHYGVELFFLLSGFVIFMSLQRTARPRDFVIGRASRLYPGYWVGMAITLAAVAWLGPPFEGYAVTAKDVLLNLSMLQRYVPGTANVDGAYWTLCLELTFYGWVLLLLRLGGLARARWAVAALVAASLVLHALTAGGQLSAPLALRALRQLVLAEYAPYFGAGMLFYLVHSRPKGASPLPDCAGILTCLLAVSAMRSPAQLLASCVCFAIFALLVGGKLRVLRAGPLLYLGAISYSLYVVHQNVGFLVIRHLEQRGVGANWAIVAALGLSLGLASLVTFAVERPAQAAIRRLAGRRRAAQAPHPAPRGLEPAQSTTPNSPPDNRRTGSADGEGRPLEGRPSLGTAAELGYSK